MSGLYFEVSCEVILSQKRKGAIPWEKIAPSQPNHLVATISKFRVLTLLGEASAVQVWTQRTALLIAASPFLSPYAAVQLFPVRSLV